MLKIDDKTGYFDIFMVILAYFFKDNHKSSKFLIKKYTPEMEMKSEKLLTGFGRWVHPNNS